MGVADRRWSYAAHFIDFDDDGDQDLYVANDYGLNGLYINDGDAFTDKAVEFGLQDPGNGLRLSIRQTCSILRRRYHLRARRSIGALPLGARRLGRFQHLHLVQRRTTVGTGQFVPDAPPKG